MSLSQDEAFSPQKSGSLSLQKIHIAYLSRMLST